MITLETFRHIALSFPETMEQTHFEKTSFRVGKKIFATFNEPANRGCIKLSLTDQDVFSSFDKSMIYPVPNKWGKQGWTNINMEIVRDDILKDAMTLSYCEVAPKALSAQVKSQWNVE